MLREAVCVCGWVAECLDKLNPSISRWYQPVISLWDPSGKGARQAVGVMEDVEWTWEKEIEQTVRGCRGFSLFFSVPWTYWTSRVISCLILSRGPCVTLFKADQFQDRRRILRFCPPHFALCKPHKAPRSPKFSLLPGLSFVISVPVDSGRCGLNFPQLCRQSCLSI